MHNLSNIYTNNIIHFTDDCLHYFCFYVGSGKIFMFMMVVWELARKGRNACYMITSINPFQLEIVAVIKFIIQYGA
jgi:hypothetical protein